MQNRFVIWLIVLIALALGGVGLSLLVAGQGGAGVGRWILGIAVVAVLGWVYWGLWTWRTYPGVKVSAAFIVSGTVMGVLAWSALQQGRMGTALTLAGIWCMAAEFVVGLALIRLFLSPGYPITGIARTLIDEAIRMKVALIFIIGMVLLVPVLPFLLDSAERLQYRMQFFLTWALTGTSVLLSLMTVFLACGTVCWDIKDRHVFMTMVKPVSRGEYLAGKWLGIMLLNLLLLFVAGSGVYTFARLLQNAPAFDDYDRMAIEEQVLVARQAVGPSAPANMNFAEIRKQRIERLVRDDPERYKDGIDAKDSAAIEKQIIALWHSIPPGEAQSYRFTGLDVAKQFTSQVQLRLKPRGASVGSDELVHFALWLNGRPYPMFSGAHMPYSVANDNFHVIALPLTALDANGNLEVTIRNINPQGPTGEPTRGSIAFDPGKGMEILYRVDTFEANLVRGLALVWIKLGFLTMLGLASATFLGFPIACLLTFMVFFVAGASEFLAESLRYYAGYSDANVGAWEKLTGFSQTVWAHLGEGKVWDAIKVVIRLMGEMVVAAVPSFSSFNPVPDLADGRMVPARLVGSAALSVGALYGGMCALIAWLIFRSRELARVTV